MKILLLSLTIGVMAFSASAQKKVDWVSTTESSQWVIQKGLSAGPVSGKPDVEILSDKPLQTIEGFGACFNELGWTSLNSLDKADRESVMKEYLLRGLAVISPSAVCPLVQTILPATGIRMTKRKAIL